MLNPDYRDMLSAFERADVDYLVIGAYAVAAHGHPRATGDIDLWVRPTPTNAERVVRALEHFGAPTSGLDVEDFSRPDRVIQLGVSPRRIDILTSAEGLTFGAAWEDRIRVELEGVSIPVLSREHLIRNKRALGRRQDLADIENLGGDVPEA
jgi:hypothetical protein